MSSQTLAAVKRRQAGSGARPGEGWRTSILRRAWSGPRARSSPSSGPGAASADRARRRRRYGLRAFAARSSRAPYRRLHLPERPAEPVEFAPGIAEERVRVVVAGAPSLSRGEQAAERAEDRAPAEDGGAEGARATAAARAARSRIICASMRANT